ncbi:hypothetical protein MJ923_02325 [Shewanella sp. 3B26]|uniref:Uncharacterized protein n=1 Tax=Shewanella zhuhaiensis TaxID=2919576 RepID=A0AAJ1BE77_9GAMM|nr:hypothetical protein [Shewanella zhuhaiensis]MCH4293141.1 hypothetical protein [Shewanella zhuhaiensis]
MHLPNIYAYLDKRYDPLIKYLFVLPPCDFLSFLEAVSNGICVVREEHGYELEEGFITFWDASSAIETTISITLQEFIEVLEPLKNSFLDEFPTEKESLNKTTCKIKNSESLSGIFTNIERQFLKELEWFYRNHGSEWNINDFSTKIKNNKQKLDSILVYLSKNGYLSISKENKYSFKVLKLPPKKNNKDTHNCR